MPTSAWTVSLEWARTFLGTTASQVYSALSPPTHTLQQRQAPVPGRKPSFKDLRTRMTFCSLPAGINLARKTAQWLGTGRSWWRVKKNKNHILKLNFSEWVWSRLWIASWQSSLKSIFFKTNPLGLGLLYQHNYMNHEVHEFKVTLDYGKRLNATIIFEKEIPVVLS